MPLLPAFPNVISGTTDADVVAENFYAPKAVPDTFDILNGWLDRENLDLPTALIGAEHVQPGAYTRACAVGGTANLDLFSDLFPGHKLTQGNNADNYRPIAGAGVTCYLPWSSARVLLRWNVALAGDGNQSDLSEGVNPATRGAVMLKHTDSAGVKTPYWDTYRRFHPGTRTMSIPPLAVENRRGDLYDRVYCGHRVLSGLSSGYHHFNLCAWMKGSTLKKDTGGETHHYSDGMLQLRFRVRGFRALVLRG